MSGSASASSDIITSTAARRNAQHDDKFQELNHEFQPRIANAQTEMNGMLD